MKKIYMAALCTIMAFAFVGCTTTSNANNSVPVEDTPAIVDEVAPIETSNINEATDGEKGIGEEDYLPTEIVKIDESSKSSKEELITHFLTMFYETNYNSRMTKFETLDDVEDYYSEFSTIVDEDCLEKMKKNREPYKYDNLYKDDPLTIETIMIEQMNEANQYSYTVHATNNSGEINVKGSIKVNDNGMITYFR